MLDVGGIDRKLDVKGRALAQVRLYPYTPAVHLQNLLGDGEAEASAALLFGIGAIDLMELLKDLVLLLQRDTRPRIGHRDRKSPSARRRAYPHLACIRELDGIADQVEQDLGQAFVRH